MLWVGTYAGREVDSRKSVINFLNMISEWTGRNSGPEEDREDLLENVEDVLTLQESSNDESSKEMADIVLDTIDG